jgi:vancomycin resistance protein YoaR
MRIGQCKYYVGEHVSVLPRHGFGLFSVFVILFIIFFPTAFIFAASPLVDEVSVGTATIKKTMAKNFILDANGKKFTVPVKTLRNFVALREQGDTTFLKLKAWHIYDYLNVYVSPNVNDEGANARFVFQNGVWVFSAPGREGSIVDGVKTSLAIRGALASGKSTAKVYMKKYLPPVTSEKEFKKLGIGAVVAEGTTSFRGSPANRVKNISVGRDKLQGVLIAPDAEFSLNKALGSITEETGFVPELVIKENVTKPEYGGGLCQISTTLFRAAVAGGFNVTERHNHAYPVKYYGTPGFDATIYSPRPDLRFINNTGNWLLLQGVIEGSKLTFKIYGKSDGRKVKIDGPHVIEKKPDGSLKTLLREVVTDKNGKEILNKLFPSEYKSPDLFPIIRKENGENGTIQP